MNEKISQSKSDSNLTENLSVKNNDNSIYLVFNENSIKGKALAIHHRNVSKWKSAVLKEDNEKGIDYHFNRMKNWMKEVADVKRLENVNENKGDLVIEKLDNKNCSLSAADILEFNSAFSEFKNN